MSNADELERLSKLRDQGVLSKAEYETLRTEALKSANLGSASSGLWRWAIVGVGALIALALGIGAVAWMLQGTTATIATATTAATEQPETSTTRAIDPTTTVDINEVDEAEFNDAYVGKTISLWQQRFEEQIGPLWAQNGTSPTEVAECSRTSVYDYFDVPSEGLAGVRDSGPVVGYLVLVCGGIPDSEARAIVGL